MTRRIAPLASGTFLGALVVSALVSLSTLTAAPAFPGTFQLEQPDGTKVTARAQGDEDFRWYEDEQGHPIQQNAKGEWVYMAEKITANSKDAVRTKRVVGKHQPPAKPWHPRRPAGLKKRIPVRSVPLALDRADPVKTPKGGAPGARKPPVSGNTHAKMATLCARYADRLDNPVFDTAIFQERLFAETTTKSSLRDLYQDMSYGSFDLTGGPEGVSGWYTVPQSRAFYGGNTGKAGSDTNPLQLIYDVLSQANPEFDFGPYDTDNDGYVDCLAVILQGRGEEEGGGTDAIWSHQHSISESQGHDYSTAAWATGDTNALGNPVYVDTYIMMPSEQDAEGITLPSTIGIFAHEYGHALGLPDLYDTDKSSEGLGNWSLMASGSWNQRTVGGDCPAWMDAWCRVKLGFTTAENITYNRQNFAIKDAKEENKVYRLWREGAGGTEYFLMENRQRQGFDEGLPGSGLLIYHVDDAVTTGNSKEWFVADDTSRTRTGHYRVALEQADGRYHLERKGKNAAGGDLGNRGDKDDPFNSGTDFDEIGLTNSHAYNIPPASGHGAGTYVAVRDITQSATTLTADVFVQLDKGFPTVEITSPASNGAVLEHLNSFAGTASDSFGLSQVRVGLAETKPDGRWWDWTTNSWGSTAFDYSRHIANASGTSSWSKSFNDASFSDGGYRLAVTAIDTSGAASEFTYRDFRIQRDTTLPSVVIQSPQGEPAYATVPGASGTATDNVAVQTVRISLFSDSLGRWYNWTASNFDAATFNFGDHVHPVTPVGSSWSTTLPADLPHGSYKLYAQALDTTNQGSDWVPVDFEMERAPVVSILSPFANAATNSFNEISGTVQDTGGVGFPSNQVSLTISRNSEFWTGSSWVSTPTAVNATITGGSWSYTSLPTDDGVYSIAVSVVDGSGVPSIRTPGENQIFFTLDTAPPELAIESPEIGGIFTEAPLPAPFISGTASDNLGVPAVTLHLKRLEDDAYWNGSDWIYNIAQAALTTAFPGGDGGSRVAWQFTGRAPRLGCMPNGNYEVIAIARDSVGNQQQESSFFVVDYHPQWLRPEDVAAKLLPPQTPPIAAGAISYTDLGQITNLRKPSGDTRGVNPSKLNFDPSGNPYVVSHSTESAGAVGGPPGGFQFHHGVLLRHGSGGWRREREASFDTNLPAVLERWDSTGSFQALPVWDGVRGGPITTAFDSAGNSFLAYNTLQQETAYWNDGGNVRSYYGWGGTPRVVVAKFDTTGALLWRALLPPGSDTTGWLQRSHVLDIKPMSNGGAAVLIENYYESSPFSSYERFPQTVVSVVNNGAVSYTRFFGSTEVGEDEVIKSYPQLLAVTPSNHVFALSHELGESVIRRIDPSGEVGASYATSYCEIPQTISSMATDAAGNLYLSGAFTVAEDDTRQCLTKLSNSLSLDWRAFGPSHSAAAQGDVKLHVAASHLSLVSHATADPGSYYPYEHPVFSRFSTDGDLIWSRGIQSGFAAAQYGDLFSHAEFDATGSILFLAGLGPTGGFHYGKISAAGDLQFLRPVSQTFRDTALLPDGRMGLLVQDGTYPNEEPFRIVALGNPASVVLPPVFDPQPQDAVLNAGDPLLLVAVDRGSAATYQWQKMDGGGVYQNLPGQTALVLSIESPTTSDTGTYRLVATNSAGTTSSRDVSVQVRSAVPLGEALEQPSLAWTTGGDAPWHGIAPQPSSDGVDSAESGTLDNTGSSWVRATIEGPTTLQFQWKVSSVGGSNTLTLWVDGIQQDEISGEVDWNQGQVSLGAGSHTVEWRYVKSINFAEGSDRAWLDNVQTGGGSNAPVLHPSYPEDAEVALGQPVTLFAFNLGGPAGYQWYKLDAQGVPTAIPGATDSSYTINSFGATDVGRYMVTASNAGGTDGSRIAELSLPSVGTPLAEALDDTGRSWDTSGTTGARWTGLANSTAHDGIDLAVAGPATDSSSTWIETTVTGPGNASFWWKTSSEQDFDLLIFTVDGGSPQSISGETAWTQVSAAIPAGSHTLRWNYSKDSSLSNGADRGFLDQFTFTPSGGSSGFTTWLGGQGFSQAELQDAQISGPTADPDRDGIANLLEYVLGLSAKVPNGTAGLIEPIRTPSQFVMRFKRAKGISGVVVQAEAWNGNAESPWSGSGIILTKESETANTETWRATLSTTASKSFMRLVASESP